MSFKHTLIIILFLILASPACNSFMLSPSNTVKNFASHIRDNQPDEATKLLSKRFITEQGGVDEINKRLGEAIKQKQESGAPPELNFEVEEETIIADAATVKVRFINKFGNVQTSTYRLVKENGQWKIDEPGI